MVDNDIPITYYNKTGRNNFEVVVFTRNEDPRAIDTPFVAWHVLKAQTSAAFVYPVDVGVGATWKAGSVRSTAGPFESSLGATWSLTQATPDTSPNLDQVRDPPNPQNTIVVKNIKPVSWSGQPFDFGLYKDGDLLVTQSNVGIGSQANFQLTPRLFFGVVSDIQVGEIFRSLTITQANYEVDLSQYTNGLIITLSRNDANGEYTFEASNA